MGQAEIYLNLPLIEPAIQKIPNAWNKSRIFALYADKEIIRKCDYRTVIPYQF